MRISELTKSNDFILINKIKTDKQITGGYTSDMISWVMGHAKTGQCWITIMSHVNTVAVAALLDLSCIIIAEGEMPDEKTIKKAEENDIALISTKLPSFEASKLLVELGALR